MEITLKSKKHAQSTDSQGYIWPRVRSDQAHTFTLDSAASSEYLDSEENPSVRIFFIPEQTDGLPIIVYASCGDYEYYVPAEWLDEATVISVAHDYHGPTDNGWAMERQVTVTVPGKRATLRCIASRNTSGGWVGGPVERMC